MCVDVVPNVKYMKSRSQARRPSLLLVVSWLCTLDCRGTWVLSQSTLGPAPPPVQTPVLGNESSILLGLLASMGGVDPGSGALLRWTGAVCRGNMSTWAGVKCSFGFVTDLNLTTLVWGSIMPTQLYLLPQLKTFTCQNCNLSGPLPANLPPALEMLDLEDNFLTGTLPADWALSKSLWYILLRNNTITGSLPTVWGSMAQLQWLDFTANQINGTLPYSYGQLHKMNHFYVSFNQLTGVLPSEWVTMGSNLTKATVEINVAFNNLTGTLPETWSAFRRLGFLDVAGNNIGGTLPTSWANLTLLTGFNAFFNSLTGTLPPEWGALGPNLLSMSLHINDLNGTLPKAWGNLSSIQELYLNNNTLTGTLPPSWAGMEAVTALSLRFNQLTGTLPSEWGRMAQVKSLSLSSNSLTGSLPGNAWALNMKSLQKLYVAKNSLTGQLPVEWFNTKGVWPELITVDLRWNNLNGIVPSLGPDGDFYPNINRSPKLYIAPMDDTFGFCGNVPTTGPILYDFPSIEWTDLKGGGLITSLPSCQPSREMKPWHKYLLGGVSIAIVITAGIVISVVWRRAHKNKYGSTIGESFLKSSLGSFKSGVPWRTPKTPGGKSGGTDSDRLGKGTDSGTSGGLSPTSTGTPSSGSGGTPPSMQSSGTVTTDSGQAGIPTDDSDSDIRRMSKTSSTAAHASRGGMRPEDLMFAVDASGKRITLGSGAFGQVYKASWHGTDVAVKVLKDDHLEMLLENEAEEDVEKARSEQQQQFEHEAALLSTLRHPNIVNFLGFSVTGTDMMVVTELCDGGDLSKALKRHRNTKAMGWYTRGAKLSLDVACGLAYLHTMGIIHYDIKPGNILLDKLGSTAKISDVGLSKSLATLAGTASNTVRGTFEYMAPELMFGQRSTFSVDVYSFGVMLLEIITGEAPDKRTGPQREPRIPEECPEEAWRLYWRCVDPDPAKRPSSSELVERLRELQPPPRANSAAIPPASNSKEKKSKPKLESKAPALEPTPEAPAGEKE